MGESAKILNPKKKVLMPEPGADCPMAHMATKEEILKMREQYDDLAVVCYINSTAELKTYSDVCVTSSNAVKIVKNLPNKTSSLFLIRILEDSLQSRCQRKNVILNKGFCPRHVAITEYMVVETKKKYPQAKLAKTP